MTQEETKIVLDAIKTRRSIRKYKPTPVPRELVEQVIEAGTYAASGHSKQPWLVVAVENAEDRARFVRANAKILGVPEGKDPFYGAPTILVVLGLRENSNHVYDATLLMGNMMLAAHALGLGSCWINRCREEFEMPEWQEWLRSKGIEGDYEGIAHLSLGYPEGEARPAAARKDCVVWA